MPASNKWSDPWVAQAFKDQHYARPYKDMMIAFNRMLGEFPSGKWLDIGCGSGELTKLLLAASRDVSSVIGLDYNPENANIYLSNTKGKKTSFQIGDVSKPLEFESNSLDGIISGLCISYAESFDETTGQWTDIAYKAAYAEIHRILKPDGLFVFSLNIPNPNFAKILTDSWREVVFGGQFLQLLKNGIAMVSFSNWLKDCAKTRRFHYLPIEEITNILSSSGFKKISYELTYAKQAWVIKCQK